MKIKGLIWFDDIVEKIKGNFLQGNWQVSFGIPTIWLTLGIKPKKHLLRLILNLKLHITLLTKCFQKKFSLSHKSVGFLLTP